MALGIAQIREMAVMALYQQWFNPDMSVAELFDYLKEAHEEFMQEVVYEDIDEETLTIWQASGRILTPVSDQEPPKRLQSFPHLKSSEPLPDYLVELVENVVAQRETIDQRLDKHIQGNWSVRRLELINRFILEVAAYEMKEVPEDKVPAVVAIDQAVDLAKRYSDDRSRRFINGVLSQLLTAE
ncbi:MAG: transcription antitermination factor NusB [Aerococcus sp.]|nr:transcription antitermination factor NusB [Aerococcus sp.]